MYIHKENIECNTIIMSQKMALANGTLPLPLPLPAKELIEAQAHIWNHTFNFINSMSLKSAIQLGIPDAIRQHGKPITLSELVDALHINEAKSDGLFRLMRILVHSKFFTIVKVKVKVEAEAEVEEEAYSLTPASSLLLRNEPLSLAPFPLAILDPVLLDPWHHLSGWFRDDSATPFAAKNGRSFWEYAAADGALNSLFNAAMACDAGLVNSVVTTECSRVFEGLESLVDVGGGTGAVAEGIAAAFPGLKCTVLELPHVVAGLRGLENLRFVGGDMFHSIPNADAVLLKRILHDWDEDSCVKILKKCKEALNSGSGKVIIVEMVIEDEREEDGKVSETKLFLDMEMLTMVTGKERSEKEWARLFYAAGFQNYKISRVLGLRSVIEVFP